MRIRLTDSKVNPIVKGLLGMWAMEPMKFSAECLTAQRWIVRYELCITFVVNTNYMLQLIHNVSKFPLTVLLLIYK